MFFKIVINFLLDTKKFFFPCSEISKVEELLLIKLLFLVMDNSVLQAQKNCSRDKRKSLKEFHSSKKRILPFLANI